MKNILALLILLNLVSCSKESKDEINDVWIRIENATVENFDNATVSDLRFGSVPSGMVTEYQKTNQAVYGPNCKFTVNEQQKYAGMGFCGTPPPPEFESGYYTYKVINAVQGYYGIEVIKR